jgi:excisionase family DNA binding protein
MKSPDTTLNFDDLPQKSLLRPEEVAGFLSVSLRTVYRWYEMGLIQGTRLNRSVRIFRESVIKQVREKKNE